MVSEACPVKLSLGPGSIIFLLSIYLLISSSWPRFAASGSPLLWYLYFGSRYIFNDGFYFNIPIDMMVSLCCRSSFSGRNTATVALMCHVMIITNTSIDGSSVILLVLLFVFWARKRSMLVVYMPYIRCYRQHNYISQDLSHWNIEKFHYRSNILTLLRNILISILVHCVHLLTVRIEKS